MEDFLNLFESDDEEIVDNLFRLPNNVRPREDNYNKWNEQEFIQRYRLSKQSVRCLLNKIEGDLRHNTDRNQPIPPMQQLLVALRLFATGSFYITVGDCAGMHKSTVGKILEKVCNAIISLRDEYVFFPQTQLEMQATKTKFHAIARFPRVISALDGTHVKIQSPGGNEAENFRCRKGYFSLNVQAMCNASTAFQNVVVRWPGATHDSTIFNNSRACAQFEAGEFGNGLILGESGYPLRSYLITPIPEPQNEVEELFNESQIRSRNVIERAFGVWKRRFPILSIGIRTKIALAQKIIVTCAILHNIALVNNDNLPEEVHELHYVENEDNNVQIIDHEDARRELLHYFQTLV